MTRLREALERAQTDVTSSSSLRQPSTFEVPPSWDLPLGDGAQIGKDAPEEDAAAADGDAAINEQSVIAGVPAFTYPSASSEFTRRLLVGPEMDGNLIEQYRRLAAALHHAQLRGGSRTVMVASAVEAEGKTMTAANVALTLSHSYRRRVLLVDADLRRPTVHELFNLDNRLGLRDILKEEVAPGKLPVQQISGNLWILTAGRPDPDPMSGLVSDTMREFLNDAATQFDWIVLDTPPVALMPDANLLASMIDLALIVVSAKSTPYPLVRRAIDAIGPSRILGVVLNRAERSEVAVGYSYYNYYSSRHSKKARPRRRFRFGLQR